MGNIEESEKFIHQDVPKIEPGLESSVGPLWPPAKASSERLKGIYTLGVVRDVHDLNNIFGHLQNSDPNISRVSLRAVVDNSFIKDIASNGDGEFIEAIIPLEGTQEAFAPTSIVYFGHNNSNRTPVTEEIEQYRRNLFDALRIIPRSADEVLERPKADGYKISICKLPENSSLREAILDQVTELYARFGWGRVEVSKILFKSSNIIGIATKDERIVSAGIAETAVIPIGSNTLRMVEITEAATRDGHDRRGVYTAVSTQLLLEIAQRSKARNIFDGEVDVVFGECNGNAKGVLHTARIQGRTFATEVGAQFGLSNSGILPQHVPISGAPRTTRYNDLFPAYIARNKLYEMYGKQ
ncbi:MAG: hypothetical protein Q7R31_04420 [Candidatus Levybacteria bacterium]|nr:hypothetical protein [Candidatus Levybacteria bacterium]